MKLVVFTASNTVLRDFAQAYARLSEEHKQMISLCLFSVEKQLDEQQVTSMHTAVQAADLIIHDPHGMSGAGAQQVISACTGLNAHQITVGGQTERFRSLFTLGALHADDLDMPVAQLSECAQRDYNALQRIRAYWHATGDDHFNHVITFIMSEYSAYAHCWSAPPQPVVIEGTSLYDVASSQVFTELASYWQHVGRDSAKPTVAVLFRGPTYPMDTHAIIQGMVERFRVHTNVLQIALASISDVNIDRLRELLTEGGADGGSINAIINCIPFRLGAGPMGGNSSAVLQLLEQLAVPLAHPFFFTRRTCEEWEASPAGLTSSEFMVQLMLPELDGSIEMLPIASMETGGSMEIGGIGKDSRVSWKSLQLIEDRADRFVARMLRWLTLQRKPRATKKVAIIGYNYPPGEANMFGGSFLDTFASISELLTVLHEQGYTVEPMTAEQLRSKMIGEGLINSAIWLGDSADANMLRFPASYYTGSLNAVRSTQMIEQWGAAPGQVMASGSDFLIPGFVNGNVFIGVQPARSDQQEQSEQAYHDKAQQPHHQYVAFYQYVKEQFGADALLHVGTHGSMEFTAGKEAGMSRDCLPDELIADLPHLYYYYVGNPSEAMIAKRRSHATLISYQSPPFVEGELYGDYLQLDELLHNYRQAERLSPQQCADIATQIQAQATLLHLDGEDLESIEAEIYRMRRSLIPSGLHVLGDAYTKQGAADHMKFVLRQQRTEAQSLASLLAEARGLNYDELLELGITEQLGQLDTEAQAYIDQFAATGIIPAAPLLTEAYMEKWQQTWSFGCAAYLASMQNMELAHLVRLLDGKYIPAKLAGDVVRHPDILPSGYNLYQFDPRAVPSDIAVRRGAAMAEHTIELYYREHGVYPATTAVVMWGMETSRTQGETYGQILTYLGVRIAGRNIFNQPQYEIIPLAELGRPRLNVVVNICGFFRDMFPNLLEELNQLFALVAQLDEADEANYFRKHTKMLYEQLKAEKLSDEDAEDLACARIFGPAEGEYGTSVGKLIASKSWAEEAEFGKSYLNSLKHVYSRKYRGRAILRLFESNLAVVDIVSQVRSNHEYEVTDLDHYYEFLGGLAKSVEISKGTKPAIYVTDTTGEQVMTERISASIERGLRTRMLNPKWIDALMEHQYHGAQKIAERFENMLGLAATTNNVDSWIFSALHDAYVADEERSKQMEANNRWAYHQMLETLAECHQRGYWSATAEELEQLYQRMMELEGQMEERV